MAEPSHDTSNTISRSADPQTTRLHAAALKTPKHPKPQGLTLFQRPPEQLADPAVSGPNGSFANDGVTNLVKYALGLEPSQDASASLPEISADANSWILTYSRPTTLEDVTFTVQVSTDLATWTATGVTHELQSTVEGRQTWQGRYPKSGATNAFLRLQVTRQ